MIDFKKAYLLLLVIPFLFACNTQDSDSKSSETTNIIIQNHSYANTSEARTTSIHLELETDFDSKELRGVVKHQINNSGVEQIIFDTKGLVIEKITLGNIDSEKETTFEIGAEQEYIGSPLIVSIEKNTSQVNIYYHTTDQSEALDWLSPHLTMGKKFPFLYTQGQAILTRTWIPIQDVPSNRITYTADIKVPKELMAVMSATNSEIKNETGKYHFEMAQPIPSYLIALAVGDISYRKIGKNSGVYAEPEMIEAVADEFIDLQKMVDAAEEIYGDYLWEKYDVIVLPFSFPFGGMENPRLTFATPTLIAGDRSLVSVIAHELAHSWSGNLVTNATWDDFWLNEGFTVYFENRIMERIYGKEIADMLAIIEWQELENTVEEMMSDNNAKDTHLKLNLSDRNPDEGMTDVAYVKGAFLLKTIEEEFGRELFDQFLTQYFQTFAFQTLSSDEFVAYLKSNLIKKHNIEFNIDEWVYQPGIPSNHIKINSPRLKEIEQLAIDIKENESNLPSEVQRANHVTQEWLAFIRKFGNHLDPLKMKEIDSQLGFSNCGNAEIMAEWFILSIRSNYDLNRDEIKFFLNKIGRRKFLAPIYRALAETEENQLWAQEVYKDARKNYHSISIGTIDEILNFKK